MPLDWLLDMSAKLGRGSGLGKRNNGRDEQLHQTQQHEQRDRRPGTGRPDAWLG
jgi:hypothetical protein